MSVSALVSRLQAERAWITQPVSGRDPMRAAGSCALSALEAWKPEGPGKEAQREPAPRSGEESPGTQHPNSLRPALTAPRSLLPVTAWAGAPPVLRNSRPLPPHTTVCVPCHPRSETSEVKVTQSCLTLCNPTDCSPPGSSVHGILQARILEWRAIPFSKGSSPRDLPHAEIKPRSPALQADSFPSEPRYS